MKLASSLYPAIVFVSALTITGCSPSSYESFSKVGSDLMNQTGLVNRRQSDALFKFGGSVNKAAEEMTDEQEYYLGRAVAATILHRYPAYTDARMNSYVNKIGHVLAAHSDRPETFGGYHVQILDSHEINAMAAPGGFIFITTGFIKILPDEDTLAALLAHEIAHVIGGHGVQAIREAKLSQSLLELGRATTPAEVSRVSNKITGVFGNSVEDIVSTLISKGYSRSQEYEADSMAASILLRTGYDEQALHRALEAFKIYAPRQAQGGWTSTHPDASDRIGNLASLPRSSGAPAEIAIREKRFKNETTRLK
jgi:beta-barrel assembly-enhancing protease